MRERLIRNAARCRKCGDEIESKYRHHFVSCRCGAIAVDGGHHYVRRVFQDRGDVIDLSVENPAWNDEVGLA
jgi:hypothetical protein